MHFYDIPEEREYTNLSIIRSGDPFLLAPSCDIGSSPHSSSDDKLSHDRPRETNDQASRGSSSPDERNTYTNRDGSSRSNGIVAVKWQPACMKASLG